ncbi:MAG: prepilin peptidase [Lentilactobacillus buchneri]|jgi:leader peptidase (prepilin peptidase)/N-methyltransferase|uniref:prepilin peptidase n=1 Tax=Lentilactobacillus hilgardii TaxID=1588 RepID=UPI001CC205C2|nr:A24 family peptidase [Lentilactobacillus hilgardii]MCI1923508.1 prepilin peptidase [Lentilactobacillus buchneri]MBZ2202382.1 peptidase [Lentilactobacillus hilgardii]MBZ2205030.1 peptidase [Lentilactobacillus hilgardii]MCI1951033.1 prepilin peptidase [Lentilactobacillus buchneri]MCI2020285.1 prepilin peptidase [Lentilactobacillus buchneri]
MIIFFRFFLGTSLASFIYLAVTRQLRCESIIFPRSHCDNCNQALAPYDLIPIISYICLMGKCRYCQKSIPFFSVLFELLLGSCLAVTPVTFTTIPYILSLLTLTYLSLFDYKSKQMPIPGILILAGICLLNCQHSFFQVGIAALLYGLCLWLNYYQTLIGNGDIDILFCLWLCLSIGHLLWILCISCITALIYLIIAPWPKDNKIPFIPFITFGYFITLHYANALLSLITSP